MVVILQIRMVLIQWKTSLFDIEMKDVLCPSMKTSTESIILRLEDWIHGKNGESPITTATFCCHDLIANIVFEQ